MVCQPLHGCGASGQDDGVEKYQDGAASTETSTVSSSPEAAETSPSVVPTYRATAPSARRRSTNLPQRLIIAAIGDQHGDSAGADSAISRRANNDSIGDAWTSGVTSRSRAFGMAAGISRIPSPVATASASSTATFIKPDTIRSRMADV